MSNIPGATGVLLEIYGPPMEEVKVRIQTGVKYFEIGNTEYKGTPKEIANRMALNYRHEFLNGLIYIRPFVIQSVPFACHFQLGVYSGGDVDLDQLAEDIGHELSRLRSFL